MKAKFRAALAAALFAAFGAAFAQEGSLISANVWQLFREAESLLDRGDGGAAFVLVEEARRVHAEEIARLKAELRRATSLREVRRGEDSIPEVHSLLIAREDFAAASAIERVLSRRDAAFFGGSFSALLSWLEGASSLPEADAFVGAVYELDGEYETALSFYERAWEEREYFDVAGDKVTLAYKMADIAGFLGNQGARENYLLLALADDPLFGTPGNESQALRAMVRTAQEDILAPQASGAAEGASPAFVKFFALYRNERPQGLKAYRELADFYLEEGGRVERALPAAVLSAVTAFTLLENAVKEYESVYSYTSFADTIAKASRHAEIAAWAQESKIWDSFLQLGTALMRVGAREFAISLWLNISLFCPYRAAAERAASLMNLAASASAYGQ